MKKEMNFLPKHVAIIPDANRRWAKERGLMPWKGHEAGAENMEKLLRYALKKNIECISFWGSSLDNLSKRPIQEKSALLRIYKTYFGKLLNSKDVRENEARINIIGHWEEQFPEGLKKVLYELIESTKKYKKRMLNFFLAYNGDDEMMQAVSKIVQSCNGNCKITPQKIKESLMTKDLPAVDYLIRTGGEPHLSAGFMMWDIANAQLYFSEKKFPDFDVKEFDKALDDFEKRIRRFGE